MKLAIEYLLSKLKAWELELTLQNKPILNEEVLTKIKGIIYDLEQTNTKTLSS